MKNKLFVLLAVACVSASGSQFTEAASVNAAAATPGKPGTCGVGEVCAPRPRACQPHGDAVCPPPDKICKPDGTATCTPTIVPECAWTTTAGQYSPGDPNWSPKIVTKNPINSPCFVRSNGDYEPMLFTVVRGPGQTEKDACETKNQFKFVTKVPYLSRDGLVVVMPRPGVDTVICKEDPNMDVSYSCTEGCIPR